MSTLQERYDELRRRVSCISGVVGTIRLAERDGYECIDDLLFMLEEYCVTTVSNHATDLSDAVDDAHRGRHE